MKVILYINEPKDLGNAQSCLEWALQEPDLRSAGASHLDGKKSFFQKRESGTVVIHVSAKENQ